MSDFYTKAFVVARKQHLCYWCPVPIERRETYARVSGKFSGDIFAVALHPACDAAAQDAAEPGEPWCDEGTHAIGGQCEH